jgi:hypothetical protein
VMGCFWLLSGLEKEALEKSQRVVAGIEDPEMKGIAQSIACAQFGLYDESVSILETLSALLPLRGRGALVQRAFVTVFSEMQERLPPSVNNELSAWVAARRKAHMLTLQKCLTPAAPRPVLGEPAVPRYQ